VIFSARMNTQLLFGSGFRLQVTVTWLLVVAFAALVLGCGGTYVDDKHNFERAFRSKPPKDVQVIHSIYWQTPHFTDEHAHFFELKLSEGSGFFNAITNALPNVVRVTNADRSLPKIAVDRPRWFAPGEPNSYEFWKSTNQFMPFGVLRATNDNRIFIYSEQL